MVGFARPEFLLLLLPLVLLLWFAVRKSRGALVSSLDIYEGARWKIFFTALPRKLIGLTAAAAIVGLSNPLGEFEKIVQHAKGYRISFAFDISGSMDTEGRLKIAKKAAQEFVEKNPGNIYAVMPFATTAIFQQGVSFTADHERAIKTIAGMKTEGSTSIGDGLLGALWYILKDLHETHKLGEKNVGLPSYDTLKKFFSYSMEFDSFERDAGGVTYKTGVTSEQKASRYSVAQKFLGLMDELAGSFVVLVSDEDSNDGIDASEVVEFATVLRIAIYVISVKAPAGARLRSPEMVKLINAGGGMRFDATASQEIAEMYKRIANLRPVLIETETVIEKRSLRFEVALVALGMLILAVVLHGMFIEIE